MSNEASFPTYLNVAEVSHGLIPSLAVEAGVFQEPTNAEVAAILGRDPFPVL